MRLSEPAACASSESRVDLLLRRKPDGLEHLAERGVLDLEGVARAGDELAADQQLHFSHGTTVYRKRLLPGADVSGSRCELTPAAFTSFTFRAGMRDAATSRRAARSTRPRERLVWIA